MTLTVVVTARVDEPGVHKTVAHVSEEGALSPEVFKRAIEKAMFETRRNQVARPHYEILEPALAVEPAWT